ncbi:hypothetical protein BDU57DRAFT_501562 [Ampelomyces quisqualis]|uniref:Uncharacterized protein n=1 Tax=Ampelomyces quisqualis TaxID=50730 RepID=A0A6A5QJJ4_AMPQU|nr:hypothetical protein BDU57DRAFT_501562 [Ampelomyces quisqualis]
MASSSNWSGGLHVKDPSPALSPSPEATPRQEPGRFTRGTSTEFGLRLANARNLRPDEAPLAPSPHHTAPIAVGSTAAPSASAAVSQSLLSSEMKFKPKYGGVKGSYTSPFDSGGKTPGGVHLPSSSTTVEEFEAKYGSGAGTARAASGGVGLDCNVSPAQPGRAISFAQMPAATFKGKGKGPAVSELKAAPRVPKDSSDRLLFLGPFVMVRKECNDKRDQQPGMKEFGDWLEAHMHESLHKVHERDEMLPEVVYTVKVPMTDTDWANYNQALAYFPDARDLHNLLTRGKEQLDQVTKVHEDTAGQLTWPRLTVPGWSLEEMLAAMVKQHSLGLPWDWGMPLGHHPELRAKEYGGSLKDYKPLPQ